MQFLYESKSIKTQVYQNFVRKIINLGFKTMLILPKIGKIQDHKILLCKSKLNGRDIVSAHLIRENALFLIKYSQIKISCSCL